MPSLDRRKCLWAISVVIFTLMLPCLFVAARLKNVAQIEITSDATDILFECFLVDDGTEVVPMNWRVRSLLGGLLVREVHPANCVCSYIPDRGPESVPFVRWRDGVRYGVLNRTKEGDWRVYWLERDKVASRGRVKSFDIASVQAEGVSEGTLVKWGLARVLKEDWESWE